MPVDFVFCVVVVVFAFVLCVLSVCACTEAKANRSANVAIKNFFMV